MGKPPCLIISGEVLGV